MSTSQFVVEVNVNKEWAGGLKYCATERMSNIDWEQFMTFMMEERRAQLEDARELREREKEAEEERRRLELQRSLKDREEREKKLQAMSEMFRESLQEDGRRDGARAAIREIPKLAKFTEGDDVEAFLTTFERVMGMSAIEEDRWSCILAPQLAGKANKPTQPWM